MILSVFAAAGLALLLYVTGFFVVLTPLPFLLTYFKKGLVPALGAALIALATLVALYLLPAKPLDFLPMMVFTPSVSLKAVAILSISYFIYYLCLSGGLAAVSRRKLSMEASFALMTGAAIVIPGIVLVVLSHLVHFDLIPGLSQAFHGLLQKIIEVQETSGVGNREELDLFKQYAPMVMSQLVLILPALLINTTLFILSLNLHFVRRWTVTLASKPFDHWPDFTLWQLRDGIILIPITIGSFYFVNAYLLHQNILEIAFINILMVLAAIYFFQGLAITMFYFRKKLPPWGRLLGYFLILLSMQFVGVLIISFGLFDFWFDFRKLKKLT